MHPQGRRHHPQPTEDREAFDRAARQVCHWTINGLLETAGEKFVGTGLELYRLSQCECGQQKDHEDH